MKVVIFLLVLLALSGAATATVVIASGASLPVPTGQMLGLMSLTDSGVVEPTGGDPVGGDGGGPGQI